MKKYLMNKKGQVFDNLAALGTGIAGLAITLVVVFLILSQTRTNATVAADANASLAVRTLETSAATLPGWVPLVVIAVVGAILLGLVALFRNRS